MNIDKMTIKTKEAFQRATDLAKGLGNQALEPEHVALALIDAPDGLVAPILARIPVDAEPVRGELKKEMQKLPRSTGGELYASSSLNQVMDRAYQEMTDMKDQ